MTKLLLVEDNENNRDMLSRRLIRQGFSIVFALDGPEAIAFAVSERPDVILMDVALGAMNGWEATLAIKANPATADIPVIALTAHALASDRVRSVEVGCFDYDTKPVDLPRLLGKIRAALASTRSPRTPRPAFSQNMKRPPLDRHRLRPRRRRLARRLRLDVDRPRGARRRLVHPGLGAQRAQRTRRLAQLCVHASGGPADGPVDLDIPL